LPQSWTAEGWSWREYQSVSSTNLVAANLGEWSAVRAQTQTAGRGRFQRFWVSDVGGLWLSAVVPIPLDPAGLRLLPLATGWALIEALRAAGVRELRMRWPNDVLVGDRKLAGLLIDKFTPGLAVIGIGVNVFNQPEAFDASLKNRTIRLMDLLPVAPSLPELAALILRHLRLVLREVSDGSFKTRLASAHELWGQPRLVELDLDGPTCSGVFAGVDECGRLLLTDQAGCLAAFEPWQVRHLTEKN
jgi:BirA family biotin operon repressor/biotin-[acetyl-CoA-carboxylase] ligase